MKKIWVLFNAYVLEYAHIPYDHIIAMVNPKKPDNHLSVKVNKSFKIITLLFA